MGLVDHDVPVAVVAVAHTRAAVQAARIVVPVAAFGYFRGAFDLEASLAFGSLAPGFDTEFVQACGELLDQFPDMGAFRAGECLSAAGLEVLAAGGDGLAEDDLPPLVEDEFGCEAVVVEFGQQLA